MTHCEFCTCSEGGGPAGAQKKQCAISQRPPHAHPHPSIPLCSVVGVTSNTGDAKGDTRFQRWDAAAERSRGLQGDSFAVGLKM